jgi:hypothetical protein
MTKEELVDLVKQFLESDETTFVDNIDQFIRLCEDEIYREVQLPDLRKLNSPAITTTASTRYINIPDDYLSAYYMAVLDSGQYYPLLSKDESFMREVYGSTTATGRPRFFAQLDDAQFILGPTPDAVYTVELEYFYKPDSLADGSDTGTTWLSEKAEGALLYGTILQGYIYLKGEQDVIASYKDKYAQAVADLKLIAEGRDRKDSFRTSDKRLPV